jgi:quercetin dioxygenase-like cupin family protein
MDAAFVADARARARFDPQKMGKATLFEGSALFAGLNAFEPGQEHAAHAHKGTDKLYVVLEGRGEFTVGEQRSTLERGAIAFAPADVSHAVSNPGPGRLLVLAVLAPPPR